MLVIRLTRVGKKNSPAYRVVVADKQKAVKRKFIEILGHYNPSAKPKALVIDKERALYWLNNGAQPSDTVNNLMCDLEILPKDKKIKKVYGKAKKAEDKPAETPIAPQEETETPAIESVESGPNEEVTTETPEDSTENVETTVE